MIATTRKQLKMMIVMSNESMLACGVIVTPAGALLLTENEIDFYS